MLSTILLLFLVSVAGLWFFSSVLGLFRNKTITKDAQKVIPPGPRGFPVIGSLHILGDLPHRDLQNLARKYGPIMHISLGMVPTIVISSAEWAEIFLKTNDLVFSSRNQQEAYKTISYGGKGLIFASYGSYWRNIRKLCTVHLLSNSKTEFFKPMRREEMAQFIDSIKVAAQARSELDLTSKVGVLVQDMTYRMIFGFKDDRSNIRSSIEEGVMLTGVFNIADYIPFLKPFDPQGIGRRMRKLSKVIDEFLEKIIDEHMIDANSLQGQHRDFIDVMLSLMDSNDTQEYHLVRDNIKAIILDMFAAAMDTTATVIVWTLSELLQHPRVMSLVQEELKRVVGLDRTVEEVDLDKLEYLQMVIKESMRLHPVVSLIPRESIEDITINGYLLPKKSRVLINTWAIGRDPDVWSSNANEFYPERFVGTSIDVLGRHFQFLPFGSGRRRCPGLHLASRVVELVVAQLVHSFDLELPCGVSPDDLDMSETFGLTMPRTNHLIAIPTYRLQN
ncbi:hypothetical protein ACHQM5_016589 [Ranunculus cassubicifolius]